MSFNIMYLLLDSLTPGHKASFMLSKELRNPSHWVWMFQSYEERNEGGHKLSFNLLGRVQQTGLKDHGTRPTARADLHQTWRRELLIFSLCTWDVPWHQQYSMNLTLRDHQGCNKHSCNKTMVTYFRYLSSQRLALHPYIALWLCYVWPMGCSCPHS